MANPPRGAYYARPWGSPIPDRWVSFPERAPYRCAWTNVAEESNGPYYEARQLYFEAIVDDNQVYPGRHPQQLYLSATAIREAGEAVGSPIVVLSKEQYAELEKRLLEANEQITSLLDDAVERDRREKALDASEIAKAVAEEIADTFARKTGPKQKAA